jgi:Zn ribbon nucleic-acid-binding protein
MFIKSLLDKGPRLGTIWRKGLLTTDGQEPQMASPCKHPRVRVVSRQEDVEYVECVECGEVFDSDEFRDMEIEEKVTNPEGDAEDG